MSNLKFKQLQVLSNSEKSGNLFRFGMQRNLITAKDNNVGKSTLVELLFWAFGCELQFDTKWTNQDCKVLVHFSIGSSNYSINRYKNIITVKNPDGKKQEFTKISGDYSKWFADIVGFRALLPTRDEELQTPPPAFFFVPFYIDQKKSWTNAWDGFERLAQYGNWKPTIVKYHVGLLTPAYFEIEKERYDKTAEQKLVQSDIRKMEIAISVVDDYIPNISDAITIDINRFDAMTDEIRKELSILSIQQEALLNDFARLQSEYSYLTHQQAVSVSIVKELDNDYIFSFENIESNSIECPICGTVHDNSVYNKASILTDKQEAENQLEQITENLKILERKIADTNSKISNVKEKTTGINDKYVIEGETQRIELSDIIESIAGNSIKLKVNETKSIRVLKEADLTKEIAKLKKEQNALLKEIDKDGIESSFNTNFTAYTQFVGAVDINASEINSPLSYGKVSKEGGAAENVRAMLSYYLTIYNLIDTYGQDIKAPFVIDTPNQHEQSNSNYEKIIQLLMDRYPKDAQLFLCAMENSQIDKYKEGANIITLNDSKILQSRFYDIAKAEFDNFEQ